ncbi:hypothetical protein ILYODFUR_033336 [Ilyodon furcidens]|uniref:Uncharacterized protein n=1 Tax=Ilyodon furcidens TaxID=33524 RepID=A0ABV0TD60_9TELE
MLLRHFTPCPPPGQRALPINPFGHFCSLTTETRQKRQNQCKTVYVIILFKIPSICHFHRQKELTPNQTKSFSKSFLMLVEVAEELNLEVFTQTKRNFPTDVGTFP